MRKGSRRSKSVGPEESKQPKWKRLFGRRKSISNGADLQAMAATADEIDVQQQQQHQLSILPSQPAVGASSATASAQNHRRSSSRRHTNRNGRHQPPPPSARTDETELDSMMHTLSIAQRNNQIENRASKNERASGDSKSQHHRSSSSNRSKKHQQLQEAAARNILSRSFGRTGLLEGRLWVVEVSPAEWDADESRWKYRILVQRRDLRHNATNNAAAQRPPSTNEPNHDVVASSFTTAFTWRSLPDFVWLEEALRAEYHGGLVLPLLGVAIGISNLQEVEHEVEPHLLQDWLSDVLNGVRGQGELVLTKQRPPPQHSVHRSVASDTSNLVASSEAMEAFLYRNTDPLPIMITTRTTTANSTGGLLANPQLSTLDLPWKDSPEKEMQQASFVHSLWSKPFACVMPLDTLCTAPTAAGGPTNASPQHRGPSSRPAHMAFVRANCTSQALGDARTLDITDSFVDHDDHPNQFHPDNSSLVTHSEWLEAQRALIHSYHDNSLACLERLRQIREEEIALGGAWKRFAISLSNLFSYEKEVENSKVGTIKKDLMPYRKLSKTTVDELLRVMAKQQIDRSTQSLLILDQMLTAYVGDMAAVPPSLQAYQEAITKMSRLDDMVAGTPNSLQQQKQKRHASNEQQHADNSFIQESLKAFMSFVEVKKGSSNQTVTTASWSSSVDEASTSQQQHRQQQLKAFEQRVHSNEKLLRESLTALCQATPIRAARMAHKYLNGEACQAALVSSAAISLRTKVNIADQKVLNSLRSKHKDLENGDNAAELDLVQRIVAIGNNRKFQPVSSESFHYGRVEVDNGDEHHIGLVRDRALTLARSRVGKWDSKVALSIMEAVGIEDAEVQVEETTRDLRLVRRHAIGLRENVSRCVEAIAILRSTMFSGDVCGDTTLRAESLPRQPIQKSRQEHIDRLKIVLSGSYVDPQNPQRHHYHQPKSALPSMSVLHQSGIVTDDPAGWLTGKKKGKCGQLLWQYMQSRDVDVMVFLEKMEKLMEDYKVRVEAIESYVYMQCLGIQLEKHFSKQRAEALAAFEKKTDINTAINIAQKKRLPLLVQELEAKLANVTPNVTHTGVKEAKEQHLLSKTLKTELGELALRRFQRARETSMDRIVHILTAWANYEEVTASKELKALSKAVDEVERSMKYIDISADGISHFVRDRSRGRTSRGHLAQA